MGRGGDANHGCLLFHQLGHTDFTEVIEYCDEEHLKQLAHALINKRRRPQNPAPALSAVPQVKHIAHALVNG